MPEAHESVTQEEESFYGAMTGEARLLLLEKLLTDLLHSDKDLITVNDKASFADTKTTSETPDPEKIAEDIRSLLKFLDTH